MNAAEEAACLNNRVGCDGRGYSDLADNRNIQVDLVSEVVDHHTIEVEALRAENVVLRGSIADCMIQMEDLRMSLRLLAECQIGRAPLIDLTAEEEPVVGNEENVVPVPVPAPFVLLMITLACLGAGGQVGRLGSGDCGRWGFGFGLDTSLVSE